jgi:hypothetical protein
MIILTLSLALTLAACATGGGDGGPSDDGAVETEQNGVDAADEESAPTVQISEDAPAPRQVTAQDLNLIELWRAAGVPQYRNSEVLDFDPHSTQVENGGVLLLGVDDSPEDVIAFYRGALAVLGWEEQRVTASELSAQNDDASLFMTVNENEGGRYVLMILTDRL